MHGQAAWRRFGLTMTPPDPSAWAPLPSIRVIPGIQTMAGVQVPRNEDGEAKWHTDDFNLAEWRRLVEQADQVVHRLQDVAPDRRPGRPPEWTRHLALFARRGITPSVREAAREDGGQIVLFEKMAQDLAALPSAPTAAVKDLLQRRLGSPSESIGIGHALTTHAAVLAPVTDFGLQRPTAVRERPEAGGAKSA